MTDPSDKPHVNAIVRVVAALAGWLVASALAVVAHAQEVRVEWERGIVPAGSTAAGLPHTEPQLAIDAADPDRWLGVAIRARAEGSWEDSRCVAFASFDAGSSWHEHTFDLSGCADPWVEFAAGGAAVFVGLAGSGAGVSRSTDGGRTWEAALADLGGGHDHPTLASDPRPGPEGAALYLISGRGRRAEVATRWTVYVSRSDDGGDSFEEPVHLYPSNLNNNALRSVVLADGTLVVAFLDFQRNVDDFTGRGQLDRRRAWAYRSSDGGRTFSVPLFVTERCGPGRGTPELAADVSRGPYAGRLYFLCMLGERKGPIVTHSRDGGERWSDGVAIESARPESALSLAPTIAVGPEGIVGVSWHDRRADPDGECQHLYFAASTDGGVTFAAPARISSAASCPGAAGNRNGWTAGRWPGGGDYSGLAALPGGRFVALWADSRSGVYQLWVALIRVQP